jgi:hypothetical protein
MSEAEGYPPLHPLVKFPAAAQPIGDGPRIVLEPSAPMLYRLTPSSRRSSHANRTYLDC